MRIQTFVFALHAACFFTAREAAAMRIKLSNGSRTTESAPCTAADSCQYECGARDISLYVDVRNPDGSNHSVRKSFSIGDGARIKYKATTDQCLSSCHALDIKSRAACTDIKSPKAGYKVGGWVKVSRSFEYKLCCIPRKCICSRRFDMRTASEMADIATSVYNAEGAPGFTFHSNFLNVRRWNEQPVHDTLWKIVPERAIFKSSTLGDKKHSLHDGVVVFKKERQCAVAFTGTKTKTWLNLASDWGKNFDCSWARPKGWSSVLKRSVWEELKKFRRKTLEWGRLITYLLSPQCETAIFSVGHSFGGMLASVFANAMVVDDLFLGAEVSDANPKRRGVLRQRFLKGGLFTFGAAGVSTKPLSLPDGRCFPGARFYVWESDKNYDPVPFSTSSDVCKFLHPKVQAVQLKQDRNWIKRKWSSEEFDCHEDRTVGIPSIKDIPEIESVEVVINEKKDADLERRPQERRRKTWKGWFKPLKPLIKPWIFADDAAKLKSGANQTLHKHKMYAKIIRELLPSGKDLLSA